MLLHLFISGQSHDYHKVLAKGGFSLFVMGMVIFSAFVLVHLCMHFPVDYVIAEYNDSFVNSLNTFGVMKQYYGYVSGFLLCYALFIIKNPKVRLVTIALVFLSAFGIRSFLIGIIGAVLIYFARRPIPFLAVISFGGILALMFWGDAIQSMLLDTRFYAYMNGVDIVQRYPFGVGLGGYPIYTENNNPEPFATFFNVDAALGYVPDSPESDLVHVFGSLGLGFGIMHLLIQFRLIFIGFFKQIKMFPFEKCMYFYFVFMTFFGISEDTMFTISYWIFFGITSGIIASVQKCP